MNYTHHKNHAVNGNQLYEYIIRPGDDDVDVVVRRLLTTLGFKSKLLGTQYLKDAIVYRYDNSYTLRVGMTNSAYIAVAKIWRSTSTRVERAIRNSIVNCYTYGSLKSFNSLAQAQVIHDDYAPSNGEFMSSVVNWLQLEMQSGRTRQLTTS